MSFLQRLTWNNAGAALAIAVALQLWFMVEESLMTGLLQTAGVFNLSRATLHLLMVLCILLATLAADEAVDRGANRLKAYGCSVVLGAAVAAWVQFLVHRGLGWPDALDLPATSPMPVTRVARLFLEYLLWGAVIVTVYANLRTQLRASARMKAAQLERTRVQRRMMESQLQALQACVEPQFLFGTLMQVRTLYEADPAAGGRMLDDLADYLRAALPQLRDSRSSVAEELRLATAYLGVRRAQAAGDAVPVVIDAAPGVRAAHLPPMVLLPLIDQLLDAGPQRAGTITIAVRRQGATLELSLSGPGRPASARAVPEIPPDIRERLRVLYGERAVLSIESPNGHSTRIQLSLPYEAADSDHR